MSIPSYVDEFAEMKWPGRRAAAWKTGVAESITTFLEVRGVMTEAEREDFIRQNADYWKSVMEREIEASDKRILDLLGVSLETVKAMNDATQKKRAGGRSENHAAKFRPLAFLAFLDGEARGLSFAETVNLAHKNVGYRVDEKTIRTWLKPLINCGVCNISPPTRSKKIQK